MKWEIVNNFKFQISNFKLEDIIKVLLKNRGLRTKKQIEEFLNPADPQNLSAKNFGLKQSEVDKAIKRIRKAVEKGEGIIVYGDYDADGICATAILWETLYRLTKNVLPYIPERVGEGYGLNENSISKLKTSSFAPSELRKEKQISNFKLLITVDHGITANEKVEYAKSLGIDVIICDHHQKGKKIPNCTAVVHTDKVCAAAIAWFLAKELEASKTKTQNDLDLVTIATIADLQPLVGINRNLVKYGLKILNETKRCGLLAIFEEAGLKVGEIGTYEVGFIIAPRLNAMGRMEHALESLRLVCTPKPEQAKDLATKLGLTNRERQALTEETAKHAKKIVADLLSQDKLGKLIFLASESYPEGIIGLTAGKLVEEFHRPAIVISQGKVYSKASARSINGFNVIEAIRTQSDLLIDAGGHPMAAGFTVETNKLKILKSRLEEFAEKEIGEQKLDKTIKIDCELPLEVINLELYQKITELKPFGIGNPEPTFTGREVKVVDVSVVGNEGKHLKLRVSSHQSPSTNHKPLVFNAIGFGFGYLQPKLSIGGPIDIAYNLQLNQWNGEERLELKIRDIQWKED